MSSLKGKIPPHNQEAEQATLGSLLLDDGAIPTAIEFLRPPDFYTSANQRIFQAIINLFNKGKKADIITVVEELRRLGELETSGGPAYVASLPGFVPTSANIEYYAKIVQDCAIRRSLITIASVITAKSFDETRESRIILEESQQAIFELTDSRNSLAFKSAKEILPKAIDIIQNLYNKKEPFTGIATGLPELDNLTCGFQQSELIIIGARPSVGKTALALTMAANIAMREGRPVAFFTLEMSDMSLTQRLIASEAKVNLVNIRTGALKASDFPFIMEAAGRIYEAPIYIAGITGMKLLDLRAQARRMRTQQKIEIIFIDYISLISSENYNLPRHEQIAEISRSLKSLARELDIPVVALSQVRRDAEGKRPTLSDIRESGSIEQDADVVIFLHRERETDKKSDSEQLKVLPTEVIIAKQRNGPVGTIDLAFLPNYTKFESLAKHGY